MPKVTRRFSLRATVAGAVTGAVSFTGLAVAADTSSAFLYVAGAGVAAMGLLVGSGRLRGSAANLSFNPDLAAGGPRRARAVDSPIGKFAAIHSVETQLAGDDRVAKFGLTVVDRQFPEGSYTTSTRASAGSKVLESAIGERRMATVEEVHRLPGAVIMPFKDSQLQQYGKSLAAEIPDEIPPERSYIVPRGGVVSRGVVTVCFCTAFAVFGSATGVLLPDTAGLSSAISSAVESTTGAGTENGSSSADINTAIGKFGLDALAAMKVMAEKDIPGSTDHVFEVTFYGYWTELVVLDEATSQRVIYHASQDANGNYDPENVEVGRGAKDESTARVRNTFPISLIDPSVVVATYDKITETLGVKQAGNDRVSIYKETDDGADVEPKVEVIVDSRNYAAKLDGTVAPIFDLSDPATVFGQLNTALTAAGLDPAAPLVRRLSIKHDDVTLSTGSANSGGKGVELKLKSGAFPVAKPDTSTSGADMLFSLSQITAAQLNAIAAANGARVGAEPADIPSAVFEITKAPMPANNYDAPPVLQVKVELTTMSGSGAIYLPDGTFVTAD